jgi:hypothetical protein
MGRLEDEAVHDALSATTRAAAWKGGAPLSAHPIDVLAAAFGFRSEPLKNPPRQIDGVRIAGKLCACDKDKAHNRSA